MCIKCDKCAVDMCLLAVRKLLAFSLCRYGFKDIGPAFLSGSCWWRGLWACGGLEPSAPLHPVWSSTDPGFSFLRGRPQWSSGSLEPDLPFVADTPTDSPPAHTPPPSHRLTESTHTHKQVIGPSLLKLFT